jgi:hypothetical protein
MVRCAEHPKREMIVGRAGRAMAALHASAPRLFEKWMARQVKYHQFQETPAAPTSGNLFEPISGWRSISGGWKVNGRPKMKRAALAGLSAAVPAWLAWRFLPAAARSRPGATKRAAALGRALTPAIKMIGLSAARSLLGRIG